MHVYVSTSVLANDIQILGFISCRDGERELAPYLEATASISLWVSEMKTDFQFWPSPQFQPYIVHCSSVA